MRLRDKLTYANVMVTILALFVLGGGSAFAARGLLPRGSVGGAQLRRNSVSGAKVRNGSLTGADIRVATLGTVPRAASAAQAGRADSATNAGHASSADSATTAAHASSADSAAHAKDADSAGHASSADSAASAADAARLGGAPASSYLGAGAVRRIGGTVPYPGSVTLLETGALTLRATCVEGGLPGTTLTLEAASSGAEPSLDSSAIYESGGATARAYAIGATLQPFLSIHDENAVGTIVYADRTTTITIDYRAHVPSSGDCLVSGTAVVAG